MPVNALVLRTYHAVFRVLSIMKRKKSKNEFAREVARPALARPWGSLETLPDALFLTFPLLCLAVPHEPML